MRGDGVIARAAAARPAIDACSVAGVGPPAAPRLALGVARVEDVPARRDWLSPEERRVLDGLRLPKRRIDWLLGRWVAKLALRGIEGLDGAGLAEFAVLAAPDGAPEVLDLRRGMAGSGAVPVTLSLSHSHRVGFAVARAGAGAVGCDVEWIEPRSRRFLDDYFTPEERTWVLAAAPAEEALRATLTWSAKESALKLLRHGLRLDTRAVVVRPPCVAGSNASARGWCALEVEAPGGEAFHGWWRASAGFVWTVLRTPASAASAPVLPPWPRTVATGPWPASMPMGWKSLNDKALGLAAGVTKP